MEDMWIERAQSAEARLGTMRDTHEAAMQRFKEFKKTFGLKQKADESIHIDFDKFTDALGQEGCMQLKAIIDKKWTN